MRRNVFRIFLLSMLIGCSNVQAHCSISVQDMLFGSYDVLNPEPTRSTAAINLTCKAPILVTINIGPSLTSGAIDQRAMRHINRNETLAYNLFRDTAMTQIWGNESQGGNNNVRIDRQMTLWIHGLLYPQQDVWVGDYSDSVTVTVLP